MYINNNNYYTQYPYYNKYGHSDLRDLLLKEPILPKRSEYSKNLMMNNNHQRPKSYKFSRIGNPSQTNNIKNNQYNINYNPSSIGKQKENYSDYLRKTNQLNYKWNDTKKENSSNNSKFNYEDKYRDKKNNYYDDYYKNREKSNNDNISKRFFSGGRYTYLEDYSKNLNSKTDIFRKKNIFPNNKNQDNLFSTNYEKNMNEKKSDNNKKKRNDFITDYLNPRSNINKDDKVSLLENENKIKQINDNKNKTNNELKNNINNNNNNEGKNENINNKKNNDNKNDILNNNNIANNKENINKNIIDNNYNNKDINKDIEVISATSKDYSTEAINTNTISHHKSNKQKSRSVNPYQNTTVKEAFQITNSIIGLNNLGATCYMNSALQNIIHCKKLIEKLILMRNNTKSNQDLTNSFINLCYSLVEQNYINKRNYTSSYYYSLNSFSPSSFKRDFCSRHKDFALGQHDSIEFLRTLLDDISKEINMNQNISAYKELTTEEKTKEEQNNEYHKFFIERENSIIIDIFYIQIINIFTCKCGFESYSFQKFLDIPLLLPMKQRETDLISLIKVYLKEERLDWSAKCEKCKNAHLEHIKKIKFSMLNEVIIFSLQRFDPYYSMKSSIYVSYNEYINLKEFCDYDLYKDNKEYRLFGTINHIGNINYGHYYAYVRIGEIWYEFNDSIVRKVNCMEMNSSSVCVLFYEKL